MTETEHTLPSPSRPAGFFRRYGHWLKWLVALGLLGLLFYLNREAIVDLSDRTVRWEFAVVGFLCVLLAILGTHVRWFLLVWAQEFDFSLNEAVRLGFLGYVSNYIAPGAIGGDAVKAVMLARQQQSRRAVAVATIILDRALGLLALFLVGTAVWFVQSDQTQHEVFQTVASIFAFGAVAGIVGLAVTLHTPALRARWLQRCAQWRYGGRFIGEMLSAVALYQSRARVLWLTVGLSVAGHMAMLSGFYFCARAVNPAEAVPDFFAHLLFMPAAELAGMIPLFPGGVGALEGATAGFYVLAGFEHGNGFLTGVTFRVVSIVIAALGTGYYFSARREMGEMQNALETDPDPSPSQANHRPSR